MANLRSSRSGIALAFSLLFSLLFSLMMPALLGGCGSRMPYLLTPPAKRTVTASALTGKFTTSDGNEEDLARDSDLPTILIFGQDTCAACGEEAKLLRAHLKNPAKVPSRIHIYTVLVGAIPEDASDWKDLHSVPWTVGIDPDSNLFKQYCPDQTVPCEIVFTPTKGIVLRKTGPADTGDLIQLTGPWD